MLVKVKMGDETLQFDSLKNPIAILLTPKDKEAIEKMPKEDQLIVSAPLVAMRDKAAEVWQWAMTDWEGATYVNPDNIRTKF
jgi:hypothetical protein